MDKIGIFFGSTTGKTEEAAGEIAGVLGTDNVEIFDISKISTDVIEKYQKIIFGTSTWGLGELQDDWAGFIDQLDSVSFSGKKVALFGTGDQYGYPDTFVDGIGILYEKLSELDVDVVGFTDKDGYSYTESKAEIDGKLAGLALDYDSDGAVIGEKIYNWVESLKKEF